MDKNMKAILEKWGFRPIDENGRIIGTKPTTDSEIEKDAEKHTEKNEE